MLKQFFGEKLKITVFFPSSPEMLSLFRFTQPLQDLIQSRFLSGWQVSWLLEFYDISTLIDYSMPNFDYTYILDIYDM